MPPGDNVVTALARIGLKPDDIDVVVCSHLHPDHYSGMADVPHGTPIYSGPGEASARGALNFAVQPAANRAFEGQDAISELQFEPDPDGRFAGVIDVLGDGSLWAPTPPQRVA